MQQILNIAQLVTAILLMAFILLQQRGAGLGGIFGGEGGAYRTKRGAEKVIFTLTIIFAVFFLSITLVNVFLSQ
ncbi:MAG TPA: preprotein translocase subunit SecG [Patescibacteria group bacterium]|nr:preprotein translocase subunit SecG [Patescibacteria group bacterium]